MSDVNFTWTPSTGEVIDGYMIWDASDPDAGPKLHFDPATGKWELFGGPNDIVVHLDDGQDQP